MGLAWEHNNLGNCTFLVYSPDACAKSELLDEDLIRDVTERFNGDIIFDPRENMMAYTIRFVDTNEKEGTSQLWDLSVPE